MNDVDFTPVNIISQLIAWFAVTILGILFVIGAARPRKPIGVRCVVGNIAGIALAMTYFPYYRLAKLMPTNELEAVVVYVWWSVFYFLTILVILWWFDLTLGQAMLRCIMGKCIYSIGNTFIQSFVIWMWAPDLAEQDTMLYLVINVACYTALGIVGYFLIARHMNAMKTLYGMDTPMMYGFLALLLIFSDVVWDIANGISRHAVSPLVGLREYSYIVSNVQYYCAASSIAFSVFVIGLLFLFYRISYLRQEESMLKYLQSEKEKQYEYSKQNMDVINQKCHDLKRQIQALRFSQDEEKEKLYEETQEAADFFDYVVKTDNEMLNTILTEKGLICHNKRIRLTCTVNGCEFSHISVIDLYTMFSNALDNAIECVEKYKEEEKRIISVHISQIGAMNSIMIENYFDGELNYENGQLVTSKKDTAYHGFGVRSIQMLVKKYKGDMRISHTNNTFSLQIMLPV